MAKKIKLIPDWRQAWRFLTVQIAALLALLSIAFEYLPAAQGYLPEGWVKWIALAIIVARVIDQKKKGDADAAPGHS